MLPKITEWIKEQQELVELDDTTEYPAGWGIDHLSPRELQREMDNWVAEKLLEAAATTGDMPPDLQQALEEMEAERQAKLDGDLMMALEVELYAREDGGGNLVLTITEETVPLLSEDAWDHSQTEIAVAILGSLTEALMEGRLQGIVINDYGEWEE